MSGFYNNWLKVQSPNMPNDITPMESGGYQKPFYFGGSQVPDELGNVDVKIKGGGYSKVNFKPETLRGIAKQSTDFRKHGNIHLPRNMKI